MAKCFSFRAASMVLLNTVCLAGCAWTGLQLQPQASSHEALESPATDKHMARFYALQLEIDRLQRERDALALQLDRTATTGPLNAVSGQEDSLTVLQRGWQISVDNMVQRLDNLREHISHQPLTNTVVQAVLTSSPAAVQKSAQPAPLTAMKTSARPPAAAPRWHYSVVYRYDQPQPWQMTWAALESAGELDKWRGSHPDQQRYFIYVGVYAGQQMANRRAAELAERVGEKPSILARQKVAQFIR